jgi:hypothetical protein
MSALQQQVSHDFYAAWRVTAVLLYVPKGGTPPAGAWCLNILDDAPANSGYLGYHEVDSVTGLPVAYVFARTTQQYGGLLSTVISHELLEMLADPGGACSAFVQSSDTAGRIYPWEICDAVESSYYQIGTTWVSDFVTPYWFQAVRPATAKFDQMGRLSNSLQLASGGYVSYFDVTAGSGWQQVNADGHVGKPTDPDDKGVVVARPARVCHHAARPS